MNSLPRMFINNTEINLWLFSTFQMIELAAIEAAKEGPIGLLSWFPESVHWGLIASVLGTSLGGTMVSFPTTMVIADIKDKDLDAAAGDPEATLRAYNKFQGLMSGALALRALCMVGIILGVHDIITNGLSWLPSVSTVSGTAGMVTMMVLNTPRMLKIIKEKKAKAAAQAECARQAQAAN